MEDNCLTSWCVNMVDYSKPTDWYVCRYSSHKNGYTVCIGGGCECSEIIRIMPFYVLLKKFPWTYSLPYFYLVDTSFQFWPFCVCLIFEVASQRPGQWSQTCVQRRSFSFNPGFLGLRRWFSRVHHHGNHTTNLLLKQVVFEMTEQKHSLLTGCTCQHNQQHKRNVLINEHSNEKKKNFKTRF